MDSRQGMVVGGAAVAVVTLVVASAVTISNVLALNDVSGQALAQSSIALPAGIQRVAHRTSQSDPVTVQAPVPVTVVRSTHRIVSGGDAQASSAVVTRTGAAAATGTATASRSTTSASTSPAATGGGNVTAVDRAAAAQKAAVTAAEKALQRELTRLTKPVEQAVHPHGDLNITSQISSFGTMQAPAIAAGDGSGSKESPSSAGSKKEQSPRSPDASD